VFFNKVGVGLLDGARREDEEARSDEEVQGAVLHGEFLGIRSGW
jgi:hypothetical protein